MQEDLQLRAQSPQPLHLDVSTMRKLKIMKKEYDDIVAHAKPKWVEEGRKEGHEEEREDNIKKTIPVILQLGGTIQDVANIFDTTPEEIQKVLDAENN